MPQDWYSTAACAENSPTLHPLSPTDTMSLYDWLLVTCFYPPHSMVSGAEVQDQQWLDLIGLSLANCAYIYVLIICSGWGM